MATVAPQVKPVRRRAQRLDRGGAKTLVRDEDKPIVRNAASPGVLLTLAHRLRRLTPDQPRRWGSMTAHQMVKHLGDASVAVLQKRPFAVPPRKGNAVGKFVALYVLPVWPRNVWTGANPAGRQLDAAAFADDRQLAIALLEELVVAPAAALVAAHPIFGPMSRGDWMRWAMLHTDHHLRQFGL